MVAYDLPDIKSPTRVGNSNGIDELVEKACHTAEKLEERNTLGTDVEREKFDEESY